MAREVTNPGNDWRTIIRSKDTRHALDDYAAQVNTSLDDLQRQIDELTTNTAAGVGPHDLLDTPVHLDTKTDPPSPGALVKGSPTSALIDMMPYWSDGAAISGLPTDRDTGQNDYWADGLPIRALMGDLSSSCQWIKLPIGTAGYVLTSLGNDCDWQPASGSSSSTPAAILSVSAPATAAQTIAATTETLVQLATPEWDSGPFWSAGAPTRLTIPAGKAGTFSIVGQVTYQPALGAFNVRILVNGTKRAETVLGTTGASPDVNLAGQAAALVQLSDGDYVELATAWAYSDTIGRPLSVGAHETFLQMVRIG